MTAPPPPVDRPTPKQYDFHLLACEYDTEGYYYPRWDQATPITVRAATQQAAINDADAALGPARRGRYWRFRVKSIGSVAAARGVSE